MNTQPAIGRRHDPVAGSTFRLLAAVVLILSVVLMPAATSAAPTTNTIYVNKAAPPGGNGTSWATAHKYLQDALETAGAGDEIWIARGIYYPDEGVNAVPNQVVQFFELTGGVSLYGGFSGNGTETSHDQADPDQYLTVLSGDIDQNDTRDNNGITTSYTGVIGQNAERVLLCYQQTGLVVIDGVVVTGGNAGARLNGNQMNGAGLLLEDCTAEIRQVSFIGNRAFFAELSQGGGLSSAGVYDSLTIVDSTFRNNFAGLGGGGLHNTLDWAAGRVPPVTIADSLFEGNVAKPEGGRGVDECVQFNSGGGGALVQGSSVNVVFERVNFRNNLTGCKGGGLHRAGSGHVAVRNSVFTGNRSELSPASASTDDEEEASGGGIASTVRAGMEIESSLIAGNYAGGFGGGLQLEGKDDLINVTVTGNSADFRGGGIHSLNAPNILLLANSIVYGNSALITGANTFAAVPSIFNISHSLLGGSGGSANWNPSLGNDQGGNIDVVPGFQNVVPGDPAASNYQLTLGSPAIDVGANPAVTWPSDLDGNRRIFNTTVDMGAYEVQVVCPPIGTTRLYVDAHASGAGTGVSWADALPSLQNALNLAQRCPSNSISEVWVAQGTYYPDDGAYQIDGDRSAAFLLKNGLTIYGGFVGTETSLSQRDPWHYITVLSGDIGQDDNTDAHDLVETPADIVGDNSYHVVLGSGRNSSAVLDGFAITGGQANGSAAAKEHEGGGLFAEAGSPTLNNLAFVGNIAEEGGAMTLVGGSNPPISNAWFGSNAASDYGGALHNELSNPALINVLFSGNRAAAGGGAIYNLASSPKLTNVTIAGNTAGGTVNLAPTSPQRTLVAPAGGGIFNLTGSKPNIRNSIIWNNRDDSGTGTPTASIRNQDPGSTPNVDNSDIQGLASIPGLIYDGTSIDADPLFVLAVDPANAPSFAGDHRLKGGSPAIDAGKNSFNSLPLDLGQQPRIQGPAIDMGPFEAPLAPHIALHKTPNTAQAVVGETITYTYQVVNTGPITLTGIIAVDEPLGPVTLGAASLAPGAVTTGELTYTVQGSDLPGPLTNTATVTGTSTVSGTVTAVDTAAVSLSYRPRLLLNVTPSAPSAWPGDTITYSYVLVNTGDVQLTGVTVVDQRLGAVTLGATSLLPSATTGGTLQYTVQPSDIPGPLVNVVDASGTTPTGQTVADQESAVVNFACRLGQTDVDNSGQVNIVDIMLVAGDFNDPNFTQAYDVNCSGGVDVLDIIAVASDWLP